MGKVIGKRLYTARCLSVPVNNMGEITSLTKATSQSDSLRTTVPKGIVRQFNMKEGDKLHWEIISKDNKLAIMITQ